MLQTSVDTSCLCLEVKSVKLGSGPASRKRQGQGAAESDDQMETGDDPSRRSGGLPLLVIHSHPIFLCSLFGNYNLLILEILKSSKESFCISISMEVLGAQVKKSYQRQKLTQTQKLHRPLRQMVRHE